MRERVVIEETGRQFIIVTADNYAFVIPIKHGRF